MTAHKPFGRTTPMPVQPPCRFNPMSVQPSNQCMQTTIMLRFDLCEIFSRSDRVAVRSKL
jgi:hypothetical protein